MFFFPPNTKKTNIRFTKKRKTLDERFLGNVEQFTCWIAFLVNKLPYFSFFFPHKHKRALRRLFLPECDSVFFGLSRDKPRNLASGLLRMVSGWLLQSSSWSWGQTCWAWRVGLLEEQTSWELLRTNSFRCAHNVLRVRCRMSSSG